MSKADLISRIESIDYQELLNSISLFISQWDSSDDSFSHEEKRSFEFGIHQADKKHLKDHHSIFSDLRARIGK